MSKRLPTPKAEAESTPFEGGIYYVIRCPKGWRLMTLCFEKGRNVDHPNWFEDTLAPLLAKEWAPVLGGNERQLLESIRNLPYAFPRGRATKVGAQVIMHHGNDFTPSMKITKQMVANEFGVAGRVKWLLDEHEQCQFFDKEEMRAILEIAEDWSAVE